MILRSNEEEAAPRPTSFLGFGFGKKAKRTVGRVARVGKWETGFWFSTFPSGLRRAVGMWESRAVGEISKGRWKEGESCFCFSTLSTGPSFPRPLPSLGLRCPWRHRRFDLAPPQQLPSGGGHLARSFGVAHLQRHFVQSRKAQVRLQVFLCFRQGLPFLVRCGIVVLLVLPPPFAARIQTYRRESARPMKVQVRVQLSRVELLH